jgi:hypothetical protein
MNDLQDRLDRLARALTEDAAPPPPELIRRRGRRRRVARAGAVALLLLAGVAFLPASRLGWPDRTTPSGPVAPSGRPTTSLPPGRPSMIPAPPRPVGPVVTVAEGTLDGFRWKFIAYRAGDGQICSGFQPVGFSTPHGYITCRNSKPYRGSHTGGLGISDFGADFNGGSDGVPDAMEEEVSRDVVRVRFLLENGHKVDLQTHGTEAGLPNNFYAARLPDMRAVRAIVGYNRNGAQVWRQDRGPKRDAWWPNF